MDQTTTNLRNGTFLTPVIAFTMLIGIGTGGQYTHGYHTARSEKLVFNRPRDGVQIAPKAAIVADIEYIKSTLDMTMTELAKCLKVSRQAPYNWIAGGPIKDENHARLNELKSAAGMIAAASLPEHALLLRRKLPGGKTLVEAIAEGGSGIDAARSLIEMVSDEAQEKAALSRMFADRQPQNFLGQGTPSLTDQS
jgi:hypothetical protein